VKAESKIQTEIIKFLESHGAYTIKTMVANSMGVPDILCSLDGRFIGIEVKNEKGVVSKMQEHHIKKIQMSGGHAFVARSVDDVKKELGI
jgi:Holliday junction resolvase